MISSDAIVEWRSRVGFARSEQVEQDLVLCRLIVEIASDELLGEELIFRGGTCLHKLYLAKALRYSEDLDYVRSTNTPIGPVFDRLRMIANDVGMQFNTEVGRHPKALFRAPFEDGPGRMKVKIEMNTYEASPMTSTVRVPFSVASRWWSGSANVKTFALAELVSTKIRALYQRRKGRDLFDLWLALTQLQVDPNEILAAFVAYRPDNYTGTLAIETLVAHIANPSFRADAENMALAVTDYNVDDAAELIVRSLLRHL